MHRPFVEMGVLSKTMSRILLEYEFLSLVIKLDKNIISLNQRESW